LPIGQQVKAVAGLLKGVPLEVGAASIWLRSGYRGSRKSPWEARQATTGSSSPFPPAARSSRVLAAPASPLWPGNEDGPARTPRDHPLALLDQVEVSTMRPTGRWNRTHLGIVSGPGPNGKRRPAHHSLIAVSIVTRRQRGATPRRPASPGVYHVGHRKAPDRCRSRAFPSGFGSGAPTPITTNNSRG
jgi:hypothetical protein